MLQQKYNKTVQVQATIIPRQPGKELSVLSKLISFGGNLCFGQCTLGFEPESEKKIPISPLHTHLLSSLLA